VGAKVSICDDLSIRVSCYASEDFIAAMAAQTTFYCGADNKQHGSPLRSLRRLTKVAIKLGLETPEIMDISNKIVTTITSQELKP
jgi:hypothetical protein